MAGIRVDTPRGNGWEYSLDQTNWQNTPVFSTLPTGAPFVVGVTYPVYCRNLADNLTLTPDIVFGRATNADALNDVVQRDPVTNALVKLLGGLLLGNIPTTTEAYRPLVLGPDGRVYQKLPPLIKTGGTHYEFTPVPVVVLPPAAPVFLANIDANACDALAGRITNVDSPGTLASVTIKVDGTTLATVEASIPRPDVRDYFIANGSLPAGTTADVFGWSFTKPASYEDGLPHHWQVFDANGHELTSDQSNYAPTLTCGTVALPPTGQAGLPTQVYRRSNGPLSITEGGAPTQLGLEQYYTDGSWHVVTAPVTYSSVGIPLGVTLTTDGLFSCADNTITANITVEIHAAVAATVVIFPMQVLNADCVRPGNQTTYNLVWNLIPTGGNARLFTSMADAATSVGAKLDNTQPATLTTFFATIGSLAVGQTVYNGVSQSCEVVDDKIYYVLANGGGDTIRKAITVAGGVITAIADSTYTTPTAPTITGYSLDNTTIPEGSSATIYLKAHYSDGTTANATTPGSFALIPPYPNGMGLSYGNTATALISVPANSVTADVSVTLRFTFPDTTHVDGLITVQNVTPPVSTAPAIDVEIIPATGGYSALFTVRCPPDWEYRFNPAWGWNALVGLAGGTDSQGYSYGMGFGPFSNGAVVTLYMKTSDGSILSESVTIAGLQARHTIYSAV